MAPDQIAPGPIHIDGRVTARRSILAGLTTLGLMAVVVAPAAVASDYRPGTDDYAMAKVAQRMGAEAWWNAGYTGKGVDVAVIDTGVAPVEGLDGKGKVVNGPDLSVESQSRELRYMDTNGHGTFMAGLIAGHDSDLVEPYATAPASQYRGVAPDARIVNIKVAAADGGTDVSQVIAAIDWVVQHRDDRNLNIRVINLSFGTNTRQDYRVDPLAYAIEQAWKAGIVVVAAGGNTGYQRGNDAPGLADPAYDPWIIAVGGYDSNGTATIADDFVASWSASGACGTCRKPDLVAEGAHMQGLRVRGSFLDGSHPEAVLNNRYFRGSGTSEAAAITSGAVALILDRYPGLSPDEVKAYLTKATPRIDGFNAAAQGKGEIELRRIIDVAPEPAEQSFDWSTGEGSIEKSRGNDHVAMGGVELTGEQDIFGHAFNSERMARLEAKHASWDGGTWNGNDWAGVSWSGVSWSGVSWSGVSWSGVSWSGVSWSGVSWSGVSWSGVSWSGVSWSGVSWSGVSWSGDVWADAVAG
ncbi:MAG: S8 family serine peptidase [Chloroflexota bacterium]